MKLNVFEDSNVCCLLLCELIMMLLLLIMTFRMMILMLMNLLHSWSSQCCDLLSHGS